MRPIFARFGSENLIRDLSVHAALHYAAFLPGDYVTDGEPSDEIYFIAEGTVALIAADKATVLATLRQGASFGGEVGGLEHAFAQATSYASLYILGKQHLDRIVRSNYPFVLKQIQREARQKQLALLNRPPSPAHQLVRGLLKDLGQVLDHKRASLSAFQRPKLAGLDLHQIRGLQPPPPRPPVATVPKEPRLSPPTTN